MAINKYKKYTILAASMVLFSLVSFGIFKINKNNLPLGVALPPQLIQINSLKLTNPEAFKVLEKMADVNLRDSSIVDAATKGRAYNKFTDNIEIINELQKQGYIRIIPRREWTAVWVTQRGIDDIVNLRQYEKNNAEALRLSLIVASGT